VGDQLYGWLGDEDGETETNVKGTQADCHTVENDSPDDSRVTEEYKLSPDGSEDVEIVVDVSPWLETLSPCVFFGDVHGGTLDDVSCALVVHCRDNVGRVAVELVSFLAIEVRFREENETDDPDECAACSVEVIR